ncbi:hypothetical protein [Actinoplanes sp. NPDC023714]|uniref:hypothetical protein n=1 Tax=Actinoplanes sp. NPDC023714 TaxID=3154322 RepID=UPI0033ECB2D6
MRFFSNEAKDNVDDQDAADQAGKATPEVPQQRAGSPWQHGPADSADRPVTHEPAPQPTAFGASTVGGAVAASAAAGPHDTDGHSTDRVSDAASGVADDRTVALDPRPGDRTDALNDRIDDRIDDRVDNRIDDRVDDRVDSRIDDRLDDRVDNRVDDHIDDRPADPDRTVPIGGTTPPRHPNDDEVVDIALEDKGTFDDPKVTNESDRPRIDETDHAKHDEGTVASAIEDKGTFDDPKVVDTTDTDHSTTPSPVDAIVPAAATTESTISGPAPFFPTAETQALKERWRDVQLRFVDDPKGATGEAAQLVDEAVDKLTTALREQRGSLAKGTEDTEALRVELRAYRDILDRLLGL